MEKKLFDLTNKVAIVTGASKGIGKSIAEAMASYGAKVVVSSRSVESIEEVTKGITEAGHEAIAIPCHVGDAEQRKTLVEKTLEQYGQIDILVNNAATNPLFLPLSDMEEKAFDKIMDINVKACFSLANLCYPIMKKNGGGSIINISSVEGIKPSFGLGVYSVSKAALIMLTQAQASEWGKSGVRVNAICPGLIKTKFSKALWSNEAILKQVTEHLPLKRIAQPEEISGLAVYLASEAASYTTGSIIQADGGFLIK